MIAPEQGKEGQSRGDMRETSPCPLGGGERDLPASMPPAGWSTCAEGPLQADRETKKQGLTR